MPSHGDFQRIYSDALRHYRTGQFAQSVVLFKRAIQFKPGYAEAHSNLGSALMLMGRFDEAALHYERALALKPGLAGIHNNLAVVRMRQGRPQDAIAMYESALAIDPKQAEAHNNLGAILKEEGRFDDAIMHFGHAIAIRPEYAEAHYNRAEILTFSGGDEHLEELEVLARRKNLPVTQAVCIHFALAKALEDSGDYGRAFEHLRVGNALKRAQIRYDATRELNGMRRISELFDRRLFDRLRGKGDPSHLPIFVLGMPRSGSTLIEQILASHPQIQASGELKSLENACAAVPGRDSQMIPWPEYLPALDEGTLRQIAESYIAGLPPLASGKVRMVDKTPGNCCAIGLIRLIFPNARIIHTTRHPVDTCVSCYSKLFETGHHYSYDLAELGSYYRAYQELTDHWQSVLGRDTIYEAVYEDVVDDLAGQARRLIDYCGLPWDERCLSFHETIRPIRTSSAVQVRKPLYRTSVQRWHRYATNLAPLLRELGETTKWRSAAPGAEA